MSPDRNVPCSAYLAEKLVETFPAFRDVHNYNEAEIYIVKKAQLLCADLHRHLAQSTPNRFDFIDINELTVMSDNVLPAVLRKLGVLSLSPELQEIVDSAQILPPGPQEVELRSLSIFACQLITKEFTKQFPKRGEDFTDMKLDFYLWCKGKDKEFRIIERHYTQDTVFY